MYRIRYYHRDLHFDLLNCLLKSKIKNTKMFFYYLKFYLNSCQYLPRSWESTFKTALFPYLYAKFVTIMFHGTNVYSINVCFINYFNINWNNMNEIKWTKWCFWNNFSTVIITIRYSIRFCHFINLICLFL